MDAIDHFSALRNAKLIATADGFDAVVPYERLQMLIATHDDLVARQSTDAAARRREDTIVNWLRNMAGWNTNEAARTLRWFAAAIERGEHLDHAEARDSNGEAAWMSPTLKSQLSHSVAKARKDDGDVAGAVSAFLTGMLAGQAAAAASRAEWAEARARAEYHAEEWAWERALGREEGDE